MNETDINEPDNNEQVGGTWKYYLALAIGINLIIYFFMGSSGLFPIWAALLCIPFSFIGANIGNFLRKLVMPSMIITNGGFWSLLQAKIFWKIGPQFIGAVTIPFIVLVAFSR